MAFLTPRSAFVAEILKALGLKSSQVCSIDISIRPDDVVRVTVGMYADEAVGEAVKRFVLSAEEMAPPGGPGK